MSISAEPTSSPHTFQFEIGQHAGRIRFPLPVVSDDAKEWSVAICGDWVPLYEQQRAISENPARFYHDLLPILQDTNLRLVNVECVLTDDDLPPLLKDGINIRLPACMIVGLSAVPFDLACLANNHILDYGAAGLQQTLGLLERYHIQTVGAGLCAETAERASIWQFGSTRLAVVNVAEAEEARSVDGGPGVAALDLARLRTQLSSLRAQVDVVIVVAHAGREFLSVPAPHIRHLYRALADAGADLVVGHHPHVAQGVESYRGVPIIYSLGNFAVLDQSAARARDKGYVLKARFRDSNLEVLELWPYQISADRLHLLEGQEFADFFIDLEELSAIIVDDRRLVDVWHAYADRWFATQGAQELAEGAALLGGTSLVLRSLLKAWLYRFEAGKLARWLAQKRSPSQRQAATNGSIPRRQHQFGLRHYLATIRRSRLWPLAADSNRSHQIRRGASVVRNRFDTLSHRELYLTALRRLREGQQGDAPEWAKKFLADQNVFW